MYNDLEEDSIKDPHVPKPVILEVASSSLSRLPEQSVTKPDRLELPKHSQTCPLLPLLLQLLSLQIQTFNWTSFLLLPFASLS